MAKRLEGTTALITGASSGIGEATALALAAEGADVALAARRRERLDTLAAKIGALGVRALVLEADITDERQASEIVETTVAKLGRLDTLVNNAGVMLLGPIPNADVTEWTRMIDLNVVALMRCTHAALPHLLRAAETGPRKVADVVNISSVAGRVARAGAGAYNATKWGVNAFSEALRQEITEKHVRIGVVEPGFVETELQSHNRPEVQDAIRSRFAFDGPLQAQDIADAIAYVVTRPRHVAINEVLIRPTQQV
ncbi:MAG TPA: SDR family NAD(P)-dependent oxidoreductase [Candidatus Limnocylindria bacterium]|jgi:NADP-dependent 3-hydroxy acid dehydrogenase YdfG|nr:SDR family NAD(P)-dependent oxidoreductase [Candidatus Limnocylindria bacterium]